MGDEGVSESVVDTAAKLGETANEVEHHAETIAEHEAQFAIDEAKWTAHEARLENLETEVRKLPENLISELQKQERERSQTAEALTSQVESGASISERAETPEERAPEKKRHALLRMLDRVR